MDYSRGARWEEVGKYFGTYGRSLDDKRRLQIPSRLGKFAPGATLFALQGFDGALAVYDEEGFEKKLSELEGRDFLDQDARDYVRITAASVEPLQVDSHGRVQLPTELARRLGIGSEVAIIGALDHFEIWDQKAYEDYLARKAPGFEELAERVHRDGRP